MDKSILTSLKALIEGEDNLTANLANASAFINQEMENINWVGFYIFSKESDCLILGPFQGKPACVRIPNGKGVCGTAFSQNKTLRVPDVHQFPGHIACDEASRSEIVIPFRFGNSVSGVLDIDSPVTERFTPGDEDILSGFMEILTEHYR